MQIHGFQKLTLLDYPCHIAATIFLGSCNMRCPFCHNADLVLDPASQPTIPVDEVLAYLKKRQGILEGVCITGGEPTLHRDLPAFAASLKALGYLVKLDTNGTNPKMIKQLAENSLIDYVAMDIKSSPAGYTKAAGLDSPIPEAIYAAVEFLLNGTLDYEFRTTVVKELHTQADFASIREWLAGCRAYYLQAFVAADHMIRPGLSGYDKAELLAFRDFLRKKIPLVELRGID